MPSEGITLEAPAWISLQGRGTLDGSVQQEGLLASDQDSTVLLLTPQTPESPWIPTAAKCHWQMRGAFFEEAQGRQAETHRPLSLFFHLLKVPERCVLLKLLMQFFF